jgi:hypothetical protein
MHLFVIVFAVLAVALAPTASADVRYKPFFRNTNP